MSKNTIGIKMTGTQSNNLEMSRIIYKEDNGPTIKIQKHSKPQIKFINEEVEYADGLKLGDDNALRTAKIAGWIFSLPFVWENIDFEHVALTIQTKETLERTLKKFAIGMLYNHSKTSDSDPEDIHQTDDTDLVKSSTKLIRLLMKDIDQSSVTDMMETLNTNGYVVCDLKYDLLVQEDIIHQNHQKTLTYINECTEKHKIGMPVIFTPMAMQKLTRVIDFKKLCTKGVKDTTIMPFENAESVNSSSKQDERTIGEENSTGQITNA